MGFQMLKIAVFEPIHEVLHKTPQEKKNPGFNFGDLGDLATGTAPLILVTGIV
jgi:hypothetical protein